MKTFPNTLWDLCPTIGSLLLSAKIFKHVMQRARSGMWYLSHLVIENPINLREKTTSEL